MNIMQKKKLFYYSIFPTDCSTGGGVGGGGGWVVVVVGGGPMLRFFFVCVSVLLNTTFPVFANSVDPDKLASSALFITKYVNFYKKKTRIK